MDPDHLPEHLSKRPLNRNEWDSPTAWLLGAQLLAALVDMLLSGLFKVDSRDWMMANTIDVSSCKTDDDTVPGEHCGWIDVLADTGDSARLVFQLAYLLQQPSLEVLEPIGADGEHHERTLPRPLPRGCALVFGGDTAYPIATRDQLVQRIRAPFLWARRELGDRAAPLKPEVKLLALPGNHDYYDGLDGFQRQFRPPVSPPFSGPRLDLPGYVVEQNASYFAVDLPCGWQLLALDVEKPKLASEQSKLDPRQREYFCREIAKPVAADSPASYKNRILVTSRPSIVYQKVTESGDDLAAILDTLHLPAPFKDGAQALPADELRLDLSGDTHIYERYWGTTVEMPGIGAASAGDSPDRDPAAPARPPRRDPLPPPRETWHHDRMLGNETTHRDPAEARPNYASVVTGLGGAFHHPSQIRLGTITPQCAWPPAEDSARAVGECLLRPRKVYQAGSVGVIGIAFSLLCFWLGWVRGANNILDIPFDLPRCASEMQTRLVHLAAVASFIVVIVLMICAVYGSANLAGLLARPLHDPEPPSGCGWSRMTYRLTHSPFIFAVLRFLGANRRATWRFLITLPVWLLLIAVEIGAIWALGHCSYFTKADDGYVALYIVASIIVLGMTAIAVFVGGGGTGLGRIPMALFGFVIGVFVAWTPYSWMRVVSRCTWIDLGGLGLFALYWPFRRLTMRRLMLRRGSFCANTRFRRLATILMFLVIAMWYAVVPYYYMRWVHPLPHPVAAEPLSHPLVAGMLAIFFGAYFTCLWLGWYFFVCLQFNVHGNEAGGAARVVQYAEFLRIKLRPDRAEVFVLAVEGPPPVEPRWWQFWTTDTADLPVRARLIDRFVLKKPEANGS